MAKQSFSTGQVLTAAQMTSLQQTAMGGGSPSTKTASYVLVAADAGTVIQMNSASATTITVNTSLFAAGDSVQIQNIGAGVCTITAGTATVNSAGTLGVTQYDGGFLYFSSASSAIWFDYTQAGTTLPLTTKGDLFGYDTGNARVPIGANDTVLTADSTQALGLKWASPSSGGMTLISTTTLSGASVALTSIPSSYVHLQLIVRDFLPATDGATLRMRINNNTTVNRTRSFGWENGTGTQTFNDDFWQITENADNATSENLGIINVYDYANTVTWKYGTTQTINVNNTTNTSVTYAFFHNMYNQSGAINRLDFFCNTGNLTSGTVLLYGVK